MSKSSGLGDNFYLGGYDLSGDVASIDSISGPLALIEATGIKQSAHQRIPGLRDGAMSFTSLWESTVSVSSPGVPASGTGVVSTYNFPVLVTVTGGTGTNVTINGTAQGSFDGTYVLPALGTIVLTYSAAPTWSWVKIGTVHDAASTLVRTDVIATYNRGSAVGNPSASMVSKQLNYDPTRGNDGSLMLKVDLQANAFGMEWGTQLTAGLRTDTTATTGTFIDQGAASSFGGQAYLQLVEFVGTSVDVTIQHATTSGGSYSTIFDFGSQTAIGAFRQTVANNVTIDEFLKVVTTGTFTWAVFTVMLDRNPIAGVVF